MPLIQSDFAPAWFAPGGHAQTLWAPLFRRLKTCKPVRHRHELSDGDFVDLDYTQAKSPKATVLLLHGLQGSSRSPYILGLTRELARRAFDVVTMHFRGCSGVPNRSARAYHSGDTDDLNNVVGMLGNQTPTRPLLVVGFSLGANVLLKWLGESSKSIPLQGAVAVCPPFDLGACAGRIARGFSRVYEAHFLRSLRAMVTQKHRLGILPEGMSLKAQQAGSLRDFDHTITASLHGFNGAEDYYNRSSCRGYLPTIRTPCHIIHALDDPFMPPDILPQENELSNCTVLEVSRSGGHIGFVAGTQPLSPTYWLELRIVEVLESYLELDPRTVASTSTLNPP